MGYSHGNKWTDEKIEDCIREIMVKNKLSTMPSTPTMSDFYKSHGLANAISKRGGFRYWANKLNIEMGKSCTNLGQKYESVLEEFLITKLDCECVQMTSQFPYDLLVNGCIKIDVKCGFKVGTNKDYYSFNLEKKNTTCDLFVCYCLNDDESILKTYVIPSIVMQGKSQLSVGINSSRYDKYLDKWDNLYKYNNFYKSIT